MSLLDLICGLIAALCAFLSVTVFPLLRKKLSDQRLGQLMQWVRIAVEAAEQKFGVGTGEEKKAYVLQLLQEKGKAISSETLDALIEAAVAGLNVGKAVEKSQKDTEIQ